MQKLRKMQAEIKTLKEHISVLTACMFRLFYPKINEEQGKGMSEVLDNGRQAIPRICRIKPNLWKFEMVVLVDKDPAETVWDKIAKDDE